MFSITVISEGMVTAQIKSSSPYYNTHRMVEDIKKKTVKQMKRIEI